ncbi:hypothetical protein BC739_005820 [Kutzneria viridogrisea]|uniref:Peptidyl-prolyl cis-trans isomerase n=2 Tax=Kutzneria TaxID=43356 RepID=W5WDB9_9PSEU|nr:FKBP-type peptidyl-prolyl cis-trans isomerase [Kutzneria albida]AHH96184.1 hypothetical protein KALB_2816 [Kutzneria albida DSM 43870]MBA8928603.1 hypothetical protein [Kutzneria viridogrisea]
MRTAGLAAVIMVSLLSVTACGGKSDAGTGGTNSPDKVCTADDVKVDGAFGSKPTITIPDNCAPPKQLVSKDLSVGTGPAVKVGDEADTNYHLVTWSDKKVVDSVWNRTPVKPFPVVPVGQAGVIQGWNEGLVGQKEGGRRLLIIPADKGYGSDGYQGIKGGETLVFVIDAVKVVSAGN